AAEVLAVPLERVTVVPPDTAITPYDQTTSSSRSTTMTGRAVQIAAEDVREQLLRVAAEALGLPARDLALEDGAVVSAVRRLTYPEVLALRFGMSGGELIGRGVVQGLGHTLLEEMVYADGHLVNGTLLLYRVPRADDVPDLACRFVENADGAGPFGAKGAGEGSLILVSPAVANALARLTGV